MSGEKQKGRIEWCDVYKGIVIILVVLGHATGMFNLYIYQFHMAAFFFISGYTGRMREHSLLEEFIRKLYKLLIPYYGISIAGLAVFWTLDRAELLGFVSGTDYPESFWKALEALFGRNVIYCDWLGAIWFLPVLFSANMIVKLLTALFRSDYLVGLASILLFLYAGELKGDTIYRIGLDLAFRAQAFLVMGYLMRRIKEKPEKSWHLGVKIALIWIAWQGWIRLGFHYGVDWPTRSFNGPVDLVQPVFGILLTINAARLICGNQRLKKFFRYLGQNSMGIMFFHFIGFKAAYLLLVGLGVVGAERIASLTPGTALKAWWPLTLASGVAVSLFLWKALNGIPGARLLLGGGSAGAFYQRVTAFKGIRLVRQGYEALALGINALLERWRAFLCAGPCSGSLPLKERRGGAPAGINSLLLDLTGKWRKAVFYMAVTGGAVWVGCGLLPTRVEVTFPYEGDAADFSGGWLNQSDGETYRWFEGAAQVGIMLKRQKSLEIHGYIPESVENITYMAVSLNGAEIYHEPVCCGSAIDIQLDIGKYVFPAQVNLLEIFTDGIKIAGEDDADKRDYSAMVNLILIY